MLTRLQVGGTGLHVFGKASVRALFAEALVCCAPPITPVPSVFLAVVTPASAAPGPRTIKHSLVTDQVDEAMPPLMGDSEWVACLRQYEALFGVGERPPADSAPTADQLSVLRALLSSGQVP